MTNFNHLFSYIESPEFMVEVYSMNTMSSLANFLDSSLPFQEAETLYLSDTEKSFASLEDRIITLLEIPQKANYLHPYDASIAAYIYLIYKAAPQKLGALLHKLEGIKTPGLWWTIQMISVLKTNLPQQHTVSDSITLDSGNRLEMQLSDEVVTSDNSATSKNSLEYN